MDADGLYEPPTDTPWKITDDMGNLILQKRIVLTADLDGDGMDDFMQAELTDANGEVWFEDLTPGTYFLQEDLSVFDLDGNMSNDNDHIMPSPAPDVVLPDGTVIPGGADMRTVVVTSGQEHAWEPGASTRMGDLDPGQVEVFNDHGDGNLVDENLIFGNFIKGSIHAFGFFDKDADGEYEPLDGDVAWFDKFPDDPKVIELTADLDGDGMNDVMETASTDENGEVWFENLTPGAYELRELVSALPAGTLPSPGEDRVRMVTVLSGQEWEWEPDAAIRMGPLLPGQDQVFVDLGPMNGFNDDLTFGNTVPDIDIVKKVKDPATGLFTEDVIVFPEGALVTFGYFVTNPGPLALGGVTVVDDNATPGDPGDDVIMTIASPQFVGGDTNVNTLLDPDDVNVAGYQGETWVFELTRPAAFLGGGGGIFPVSTSLMDDFLLIGTTSNEIAKAVNVQNGDLGADIVVLSTEINDNVDFDLDDVFLNNAGSKWVDVDNAHNTDPDFLPGAAQVGEGVSWTGDVALTSPDAAFDMSNVELYGQVGVVADSSDPVSSVSNSLFFQGDGMGGGVGDGFDPTGGLALPPAGVTADANAAMAALRAELDAFEAFVTGLAPEVTLSPGMGLPTSEGIEDVDIFELNVDPFDMNGDGIAVIDIVVDGGNSDFKITNSNWIIESEMGTFAIFRILGDSNLVLNQSTIVVGDGIQGNGGVGGVGPGAPVTNLGAIFIKANDYSDGSPAGRNAGEPLSSGDTVFSFNDTVLNGVGFYDLIAFDEENTDPFFDNGTTELKINNGQGCAHFISPKINFNDVRFERCSIPEGRQEQTNTAEATGNVSGVTVSDSDSQTIAVSAATVAPAPASSHHAQYTADLIELASHTLKRKSATFSVTNNGTADVTIESIMLDWADRNGGLRKIRIGGETIYRSYDYGETSDATIDTFRGSDALRTIEAGETINIKFIFENYVSADLSQYSLSITLTDDELINIL